MTNQLLAELEMANREIERLNNIIKEVREYTNKYFVLGGNTYKEKVLEILDKENI